MSKTLIKLCPCDSGLPYNQCCGKYHKGKIHAPTAEALMRSRYSAYVLNLPKYIFRTWDKKTRPTLKSLQESKDASFIKLEIVSNKDGLAKDQSGEVIFIATYQNKGEKNTLKEHSYFRKKNNRWVYVDAINNNINHNK